MAVEKKIMVDVQCGRRRETTDATTAIGDDGTVDFVVEWLLIRVRCCRSMVDGLVDLLWLRGAASQSQSGQKANACAACGGHAFVPTAHNLVLGIYHGGKK